MLQKDEMKIGWFVGVQDWAIKNLTEALVIELKNDIHFFNEGGDVNVLMSVDQLRKKRLKPKNKTTSSFHRVIRTKR